MIYITSQNYAHGFHYDTQSTVIQYIKIIMPMVWTMKHSSVIYSAHGLRHDTDSLMKKRRNSGALAMAEELHLFCIKSSRHDWIIYSTCQALQISHLIEYNSVHY